MQICAFVCMLRFSFIEMGKEISCAPWSVQKFNSERCKRGEREREDCEKRNWQINYGIIRKARRKPNKTKTSDCYLPLAIEINKIFCVILKRPHLHTFQLHALKLGLIVFSEFTPIFDHNNIYTTHQISFSHCAFSSSFQPTHTHTRSSNGDDSPSSGQ